MNELIAEEKNEKVFSHFYKTWAQCVSKQIFNRANHYESSALLSKLFRQATQS